jgi:signal transduction histidine kinase
MDREMMEQLLINLIRNAIDALPAGREGIIEVHASMEVDKSVLIRLMDNGTGIPAEILDQVFMPFYTTKEKGSGIGLSLSRRIINRHGGNIQLSSKSGKGTTAAIKLPGTG